MLPEETMFGHHTFLYFGLGRKFTTISINLLVTEDHFKNTFVSEDFCSQS